MPTEGPVLFRFLYEVSGIIGKSLTLGILALLFSTAAKGRLRKTILYLNYLNWGTNVVVYHVTHATRWRFGRALKVLDFLMKKTENDIENLELKKPTNGGKHAVFGMELSDTNKYR